MRKIRALYDKRKIRIYQAYNREIADEAIAIGTFGEKFKRSRMTWIKPSFLWMMYRSGWGEKASQERILSIDMKIEGFMEILKNSVLSHYEESVFSSKELWEKEKIELSGRCQWDPERDIYGNPLNHKTIQLGIKERLLEKYVDKWIVEIEDITERVKELKIKKDMGEEIKGLLPKEKEFKITNNSIIRRLMIDTV